MTPEQLSDAIGAIDDDMIVTAKQPTPVHRWRLAAAGCAACAVIAIGAVLWWTVNSRSQLPIVDVPDNSSYTEQGTIPPSDTYTGGVVTPPSEAPSLEDSDPADGKMPVYYIDNGQIRCRTFPQEYDPQTVFDLWKSLNRIGNEVQLLSVQTEHSDGQTISTLTITKSLERYYAVTDQTLLLVSLEQTLSAADDDPPDAYRVTLTEG